MKVNQEWFLLSWNPQVCEKDNTNQVIINTLRAVIVKCVYLCVCTQVHLTLCYLMDCSQTGFFVHGTFQARILEWVPMSSSRVSSKIQGQYPHLLQLLHWQVDSLPLHHLVSPIVKYIGSKKLPERSELSKDIKDRNNMLKNHQH